MSSISSSPELDYEFSPTEIQITRDYPSSAEIDGLSPISSATYNSEMSEKATKTLEEFVERIEGKLADHIRQLESRLSERFRQLEERQIQIEKSFSQMRSDILTRLGPQPASSASQSQTPKLSTRKRRKIDSRVSRPKKERE